jgi:putative transcriptional regulator
MGLRASTKGRLLVATPLLTDPNFDRTVILVLEDSEEGALGLVLNRPSPLAMDDPLPDWSPLAASPPVVFVGGPVSRTSVIALARRVSRAALPDEQFTPVVGAVGVLDLSMDADTLSGSVDDVRVFAGYAGWGYEQLGAEIDEWAWFVVDAEPADAMSAQPETLWRDVLRRQPEPLRRFAHYPPDVSAN